VGGTICCKRVCVLDAMLLGTCCDNELIRFLDRHKVAKVDQMETAIGKTMRERETKSKADKIIKRGLSYVLTAGTLVDSGLLTSDMSIYCMSIKVRRTGHLSKYYA
jgi:DNA mismatch repair ATPase MutS